MNFPSHLNYWQKIFCEVHRHYNNNSINGINRHDKCYEIKGENEKLKK